MISFNSLLIVRQAKVNNGLSLKSLAADLLNVCLDKSLELRCSDWEADELTTEQVAISLCFSAHSYVFVIFQNYFHKYIWCISLKNHSA